MKTIKYIVVIAIAFGFTSCGKEYLDTKSLYRQLDDEYFSNPEEIAQALTGAYACLPTDQAFANPNFKAILLSDDNFGGGGPVDIAWHATDAFESIGEDMHLPTWETYYQGIFRTNMIIDRFDQAEYDDLEIRSRDLGEVHFLRAYFYFKLAQLFGTVPLITSPEPLNKPKAEVDDLFAQIATDLKTGCDIMPSEKYSTSATDRLGHANKWAAEALLARVYLFYTGYYNKNELPLNDGAVLTKTDVIAYIDDCINNSGYALIADYRNLWPYSSINGNEGGYEYRYASENNLNWIGEEGENTETVFAIKYSPFGGFNAPGKLSYSNQLVTFLGLRRYPNAFPFGKGWGGGTVSPLLWDSFEEGDIRREASMFNILDKESIALEGNLSEQYTALGNCYTIHETGIWQKKYTPILAYNSATGELTGMYSLMYGQDQYQLRNMQDEVLIRFSDVLLMGAELKEDAELLNRVRARVHLDPVAYSLEALKAERRHELAFEGFRYFDLLRWHDAEKEFAKLKDIPVYNTDIKATYNNSFRSETGGFLPIPESQIRLSNGVLKQNTGW